MTDSRGAVSVVALGVASGLGTVDLVGIRPDLPAIIVPLLITVVASVGAALSPPARVLPGKSRLILGLFGSWLAWSYLSALTSADPALAMATTASFVAVMLGAMGVAAHRSRTSMLTVMAIAALVQAMAALGVAFTVEFDQFPSRLSLVDLEPNHLGRLLALASLVSVLWLLEQPRGRWPVAVAFTGVCLLGLLLTGSRTAPSALVVAGFIALIASRRWKLLIAGGFAGVIVVGGLLASGFDARIVELTNRSGSELSNLDGGNGRTTLWPEVLNVIEDHPITGIGLGVDRERMQQINDETAISWNPQHAHNLLLHLAFTTGWIGAALFLSAMVIALAMALWRQDPWVGAIVAFVLFDGIAEPMFRIPQPTWAVLIGVVTLAFVKRSSDVAHQESEADLRPLLARRNTDVIAVVNDVVIEEPNDRRSVHAIRSASPLPFGPVLVSSTLALCLAVGLVWQEPGEYPVRFRCRDEAPLDATGLLVDVDPAAGIVTLPNSVTPLPQEHLVDGSVRFLAGETGVLLPSGLSRVVRCGAVRENGITIEFDVATSGLTTEGPGRIFSISIGPEWSEIDLHVGQALDGLSLRLRQSSSYRNDATIPGIFTDLETHRIRVTVWPDRVAVAKDGVLVETWTGFESLKFDEWYDERTALLGNEATGDRPFVGTLDRLRIYEGQLLPDQEAP